MDSENDSSQEKTAEEGKTEARAEEVKKEPKVEEAKAEGAKEEGKTEEVKREAKVEGAKVEGKTEEVKMEPKTLDSRMLVLLVVVVILVLSNILTAFMALNDNDEDEHDDDNGHTNGDEPETRTPVIENISVEGAYDFIQAMEGSTNFTIIDVRTVEEYNAGHIPGALNFDVREDSFNATIRVLDRNLSYLVYCKSGGRSGMARDLMTDTGFMEINNMLGGFNDWLVAGYEYDAVPVVERPQNFANLTVQESYNYTQNNTSNSQFVILDLQSPEEYDEGHLNNSIHLDFFNESFEDILAILDRDLTYLIYSLSGDLSGMAMDMMYDLWYWEVTNMLGGFVDWKNEGLPYRT